MSATTWHHAPCLVVVVPRAPGSIPHVTPNSNQLYTTCDRSTQKKKNANKQLKQTACTEKQSKGKTIAVISDELASP